MKKNCFLCMYAVFFVLSPSWAQEFKDTDKVNIGFRYFTAEQKAIASILAQSGQVNGIIYSEKERFQMAEESAKAGNVLGEVALARIYKRGTALNPKDEEKAAELFKKAFPRLNNFALKEKHAFALDMLGDCYFSGDGVEKDFAKALEFYRLSDERGLPMAAADIGNCYYQGKGVAKDFGEAATWYRKAAEQGYAGGQWMMGVLYYQGKGVAKDFGEAATWSRNLRNRETPKGS